MSDLDALIARCAKAEATGWALALTWEEAALATAALRRLQAVEKLPEKWRAVADDHEEQDYEGAWSGHCECADDVDRALGRKEEAL